jgi:hypothetical protein
MNPADPDRALPPVEHRPLLRRDPSDAARLEPRSDHLRTGEDRAPGAGPGGNVKRVGSDPDRIVAASERLLDDPEE